jgi:serine/threonine protein phosphatase PrpC
LSTVLTQSLKTAKPKEALKQAFLDMHAQMKADDIKSGATALAALFTKNKVFIANAGDSRAVLCRGDKAIRLTTDHRPDIPQEIERISKLGGNITNDVTKDG